MKIRKLAALLAAVAILALLRASEGELPRTEAIRTPVRHNFPPIADAGRDFITYVGLLSEFRGYGAAPDDEIVSYEWDFDGDGIYDFQSSRTGVTSHVYDSTGTYTAILRVRDAQGNIATDSMKVIVRPGTGTQGYLPSIRLGPAQEPPIMVQGDGIVDRYAMMINGGSEARFWNDVTFMYPTLTDDYDFPPERIFLFNHDGTNPDGINPGNMIDYPASVSDIDAVFTSLSGVIDDDDELFVWVTDHGSGYRGPQSPYYGYLDGFASIDPGDEQDYLETEFKLRSTYTGGDYPCNHGLNVWKVYYKYSSYYGAYMMYRNKYVTGFTDVAFEQDGMKSDSDILIERLYDLLRGDTNRNAVIEQGEVFDYDGDGIPPYDDIAGVFDEDDWVGIYTYDDDWSSQTIIRAVDENQGWIKASFFDADGDDRIDIDVDYDETDFPNNLQSDGEDIDGAGLFDGIDLNDDGDMDDWVSIDEKICLTSGDMLDDELAIFLNRIDANVISVFMEPCFSGGFIDDLSAPNRVISTATEEETVSWGNLFVRLFTGAFHGETYYGTPVDADYNHNGHISMAEAFHYAAENDSFDEIPQYDDNGDGIGHPYPIPQGGDGSLGAVTYLESFHGLTLVPATDTQFGGPGTVVTYELQVTNTGNIADTFDVAVSGHSWPTTAPATIGPLAAGSSTNLDVTVNIPMDATNDAIDSAIVIVTSQGDNTQSAPATLTTTVGSYDLFLPVIVK